MESEVLKNILLVITVLAVFVFGFFVMKLLDKFLNENHKTYFRENKKNQHKSCITRIRRTKKSARCKKATK